MLFTNVFSDMFDDMFSMPTVMPKERPQRMMNCDVREFGDHYELNMDLAGYKKEDIQAELKDGYLTIKAQRGANNDEKDDAGRIIRSERFMGSCQRTFFVGRHVRREDVSAAYEDGVLKLAIPKEQERPQIEENRFISIQ